MRGVVSGKAGWQKLGDRSNLVGIVTPKDRERSQASKKQTRERYSFPEWKLDPWEREVAVMV